MLFWPWTGGGRRGHRLEIGAGDEGPFRADLLGAGHNLVDLGLAQALDVQQRALGRHVNGLGGMVTSVFELLDVAGTDTLVGEAVDLRQSKQV